MNEDTLFFTTIVLVFTVALWLEWRYRLKSLRIAVAILALAMLWFFQPLYHAAWRQAIGTAAAERVVHWHECLDLAECARGAPGAFSDSLGARLSEYQSGVFTMYRAVIANSRAYANARWLMVAVLFWLACSPVFRRTANFREPKANEAPGSS